MGSPPSLLREILRKPDAEVAAGPASLGHVRVQHGAWAEVSAEELLGQFDGRQLVEVSGPGRVSDL